MVGSCTKVGCTIVGSGRTVSLDTGLPTAIGSTATGSGLATKLGRVESALEVAECFFEDLLLFVLVPLLIDKALEIFTIIGAWLILRMSGRKMGRDAHTMLMPACIVVHNSVFEYEGTRLFGLYPRTTLTRPVTIVL